MKKRNKSSLKKYMAGTAVKNYMKDPNEVMTQNQINVAKAQYEAESNPWIKGLETTGNLLMQYGMNKMAGGGKVPQVPVEVEGGEVGETPDGDMVEFKGPDHENGGIPIDLPEGTEIFSKRIKKMGDSMAERKMKREKSVSKLQKVLNKNPNDILTKKTLSKVMKNNEAEEKRDMEVQEQFSQMMNDSLMMACGGGVRKKMGNGGLIDLDDNAQSNLNWGNPIQGENILTPDSPQQYQMEAPQSFAEDVINTPDNSVQSPATNKSFKDYFSGLETDNTPTGGDLVGMIGTGISAVSPLLNTLKNRAGDKPNTNFYKDYGKEGLNTIQNSQQYIAQERDRALKDLASSRQAAIKRGRGSARSINTARALDLSTEQAVNKAQSDIYSNFANQMMQSMGVQAGMENQRDQLVMRGEEARDTADTMDRDKFYTNRGRALSTLGSGTQAMGKNLNQIYARGENQDMINKLTEMGLNQNQINSFMQMFLKSKGNG